jgi:hypothetical protein
MADLSREQIETLRRSLTLLLNVDDSPQINDLCNMALASLSDDSVRVPMEPTEEMIEAGTAAGIAAVWNGPDDTPIPQARQQVTEAIYKAMLAASERGAG